MRAGAFAVQVDDLSEAAGRISRSARARLRQRASQLESWTQSYAYDGAGAAQKWRISLVTEFAQLHALMESPRRYGTPSPASPSLTFRDRGEAEAALPPGAKCQCRLLEAVRCVAGLSGG